MFQSVAKRMRWKANIFDSKFASKQKETYGFKTARNPDSNKNLEPFEAEMYEVICGVEFKDHKSNFQRELNKDVKELKASNSVYVHADKSTNIYTMSKEMYEKFRIENVTKTYKKACANTRENIDKEAADIAARLDIADRMEAYAVKEPFITMKDHKDNFESRPSCRLINPAKSEMGRVSKQILQKITTKIRDITKLNQWISTTDAINWFLSREHKQRRLFIQFDIESFYPSITLDVLTKALEWAETMVDIADIEKEIVFNSRKSLLFYQGAEWIKKNGSDFDVTMGSFDGAEVCELVGLYLLHLLAQELPDLADDIGLYRDDGVIAPLGVSMREADRIRKKLIAVFKANGFSITVEILPSKMNFLDVTFDLKSGKYWPYRKPNNTPLYVHCKSNHPPAVIKQIPKGINDRLVSISCDKEVFEKAKPDYEEALRNSGYKDKLEFDERKSLASENHVKSKRKRKPRDIIWFNPPYDQNCKVDVGRKFLQLLDKHFPRGHQYRGLFNRNTVKLSYSCMPNMGAMISSHNANILNPKKDKNEPSGCNCQKKKDCPMPGNCKVESFVYKATISAPSTDTKHYIGMTEGMFKTRYTQHKSSMRHPSKRSSTVLSQYYWNLVDAGVSTDDIKIQWAVVKKAQAYKCGTRRCDLCLTESTVIALYEDKTNLLNKRSELVGVCPHMTKYRLAKKVRKK